MQKRNSEHQNLILVTNDDGIESDGLWAAVEALLPLGEVVVVAPDRQWSGGGRSMPPDVTGHYRVTTVDVDGRTIVAYAVDASPALTVVHGVVEFTSRRPDLVVSGINYGANLGIGVTISGTVGAALEGGAFGIPAIAVSLEMDSAYHLTGDDKANYAAAKAYTQRFARQLLDSGLSGDVQALNINLPCDAKPETPWRLTRLSRQRYYLPLAPDRENGNGRPGYKSLADAGQTGLLSDVRAVQVDRIVSVTPLSLDLTSREDLAALDACLRGESAACPDETTGWPFPVKDRQPAVVS
jgi:5'-nucleotidase